MIKLEILKQHHMEDMVTGLLTHLSKCNVGPEGILPSKHPDGVLVPPCANCVRAKRLKEQMMGETVAQIYNTHKVFLIAAMTHVVTEPMVAGGGIPAGMMEIVDVPQVGDSPEPEIPQVSAETVADAKSEQAVSDVIITEEDGEEGEAPVAAKTVRKTVPKKVAK